jgi:hypothetical protein
MAGRVKAESFDHAPIAKLAGALGFFRSRE